MMNNNNNPPPYQQFQPIPQPGSSSTAPYPPQQQQPPPVLTDEQRIHAEQYWATHNTTGATNLPTTTHAPIYHHTPSASWDGSGAGGGGGGTAVGNPNYQHSHYAQNPYVTPTPAAKPYKNTVDTVLKRFNSWGSKAEKSAQNVWHNLKTGPSVSGTAWGKVNLTAKAMTEGGFEALFKQTFTTFPQEKLKKTFACHLSTSSGPVAGTLYLSNLHVAFCSDSPLSFKAPSGLETWSYYKIMVPLGKIATINPVTQKENSMDKYIQISTFDAQEFWFMGFVNHDKASKHLSQSISGFAASGVPVHQQPF